MVISDMFLKEKGKSWVFTGGSAAAGRFAENEGRRGCAGLFEEVIRWDMAMDSMAARERFVFNTARPGLNAVDIVEEFGRRAACYHPQGVVYISGSEDEALAEEVLQGALGEMERLAEEIGAGFLCIKYQGDSLQTANAILKETGARPSLVTYEDRNRFALRPARQVFEKAGNLKLKQEPMRWLFIGDSITHGALHTYGFDSLPQLWEKYIREDWGREDDVVLNVGVSSATAEEFLGRLDVRYYPYSDADVVVAMFGTNDCVISDVQVFREQLVQIGRIIEAKGSQLVLRTPPLVKPGAAQRAVALPAFAGAVREAAAELGVILIDHEKHLGELRQKSQEGWEAGMNDDVHPNAAGQYWMFRELAYGLDLVKGQSMVSLEYM